MNIFQKPALAGSATTAYTASGNSADSPLIKDQISPKRKFYDIVLLIGVMCCVLPGVSSSLSLPMSMLLMLCIVVSFFDENFFMYTAMLMYMRYRMLIGDTPVFRLYSYLVVARFLMEIFKTRFRVAYIPALFVIALHSLFALPKIGNLWFGFNVIVDTTLMYIIMLQVSKEPRLMRKFITLFMMGGLTSGIYTWLNPELTLDIHIAGAGAHKVNRSFGVLGDTNFAGLFYSLCMMCSLTIRGIPKWLRGILPIVYLVLILQTASLSALLITISMAAFIIVLKFRGKSVFILMVAFLAVVVVLSLLLTIPWFRKLDMIAGLIIRIEEKLSYIPRGRWDLLTTDRTALWGELGSVFMKKDFWGKLIGGSVITVMVRDEALSSSACHNSYIQSLLNFGILGTVLIYVPLLAVFAYRMYRHFSTESGYEDEDIKMIQLVVMSAFIVFGVSVDFFVDWSLMMFYFI